MKVPACTSHDVELTKTWLCSNEADPKALCAAYRCRKCGVLFLLPPEDGKLWEVGV